MKQRFKMTSSEAARFSQDFSDLRLISLKMEQLKERQDMQGKLTNQTRGVRHG